MQISQSSSNRHSEGGVVVVVLTLALVVAVLFILGWVAWRIVSGSEQVDTQHTTHAAGGVLTLDAWGVEIPYDGKQQFFIEAVPPTWEGGRLSWEVSVASIDGCITSTNEHGRLPIGVIWRHEADSQIPTDSLSPGGIERGHAGQSWAESGVGSTVDGWTYVFNPPQNACGDATTSEGERASREQAMAAEEFDSLLKDHLQQLTR